MNRRDAIVAGAFLLAGAALLAGAYALPPGMGGLPGPGFFPGVVAAVMILLAGAQLYAATQDSGDSTLGLGDVRAVGAAAGLLFVYLLLWGSGWFALRSAVFLALFLRFLGQEWKQAVTVSLALSAAVALAFQYGLRVSLE